jgi:phosphonoacetaldehyde hydrolase
MNPYPHIRGIIFDISGTIMDYGSRGPAAAFVEVFQRNGVSITEAQARGPMGLHKRDHIAAILRDHAVAQLWQQAHGHAPSEADIDHLFAQFGPLQLEVLSRHFDMIPGVVELVQELTRMGIPYANTTGFDSWMMRDLIPAAEAQGYRPAVWMTPDQAGGGRPAPWMAFRAAQAMNAYPPHAIVKVGDTPADIAEAKAAGMWAVAVVEHGNEVGYSAEALAAMPAPERESHFDEASCRFERLHADFVLPRTADLLQILPKINEALADGERPR